MCQYYDVQSENKEIRRDSAESIKNELTSLLNTSEKFEENVKKLEGLLSEIN